MKVTKMNDVSDKHSWNASKKNKLHEAMTEAMQMAEFKEFCRREIGSPPSDFIIWEYTRTTAAVVEGKVSRLSTGKSGK